jgi:hypothetical protein
MAVAFTRLLNFRDALSTVPEKSKKGIRDPGVPEYAVYGIDARITGRGGNSYIRTDS